MPSHQSSQQPKQLLFLTQKQTDLYPKMNCLKKNPNLQYILSILKTERILKMINLYICKEKLMWKNH